MMLPSRSDSTVGRARKPIEIYESNTYEEEKNCAKDI